MDLRSLSTKSEQRLTPRAQTWNLTYTAPNGQSFSGACVSTVPDGDGRIEIARKMARLCEGSWESLPMDEAYRLRALSTLSIQLSEAPDWVNKWSVEDDELLFALYGRALKHTTAWFLGTGESGEEDEAKPRVVFQEDVPPSA